MGNPAPEHTSADEDDPPTVSLSGSQVAESLLGHPSTSGVGRVAVQTQASALERDEVAEALRAEEVARARGFSLIVVLLTLSALPFVPVLPGSLERKAVFVSSLLLLCGTGYWVRLRTRIAAHYTQRVFTIFGYVAASVALELVYFLGVYSATPLAVTLGVIFFGMGSDAKQAVRIPVYAILGYFTLAMLTAFDVIEDHGVISSEHTPFGARLFFSTLAPLVLTVTLWFSRMSRSSMAHAIKATADATRLAVQRGAELAEVQLDFEQALRAGAGQSGRMSGAMAGRYELAEVIGRGAMGEVYAAHDAGSGERVAIKLLRAEACETSSDRTRFVREGEVTQRLDVPNVVKVLGTGFLDLGTPYIAMEFLEGEDLAALLRRQGRLEHDRVVRLIDEVASGLDAAHRSGIVHRDVKPQNLFLARASGSDVWKILDFGVSTFAGSSGTLTQAGMVGTPGYMAPEQVLGAPTDARADVFSLGAVAYRCLTGRRPFEGRDTAQMVFEIVYKTPSRPSMLMEGLPRDVDRVLALALAKSRDLRPRAAGELARALKAALSNNLDASLRRRADALILKHPWDAEVPR